MVFPITYSPAYDLVGPQKSNSNLFMDEEYDFGNTARLARSLGLLHEIYPLETDDEEDPWDSSGRNDGVSLAQPIETSHQAFSSIFNTTNLRSASSLSSNTSSRSPKAAEFILPISDIIDGMEVRNPSITGRTSTASHLYQGVRQSGPSSSTLSVRHRVSDVEIPPCDTLFIGNISPDVDEEELESVLCKAYGYVSHKIQASRNAMNGPNCWVMFENANMAKKARQWLNRRRLWSNRCGGLRVSFSRNPMGHMVRKVEDGGAQGFMSLGSWRSQGRKAVDSKDRRIALGERQLMWHDEAIIKVKSGAQTRVATHYSLRRGSTESFSRLLDGLRSSAFLTPNGNDSDSDTSLLASFTTDTPPKMPEESVSYDTFSSRFTTEPGPEPSSPPPSYYPIPPSSGAALETRILEIYRRAIETMSRPAWWFPFEPRKVGSGPCGIYNRDMWKETDMWPLRDSC